MFLFLFSHVDLIALNYLQLFGVALAQESLSLSLYLDKLSTKKPLLMSGQCCQNGIHNTFRLV